MIIFEVTTIGGDPFQNFGVQILLFNFLMLELIMFWRKNSFHCKNRNTWIKFGAQKVGSPPLITTVVTFATKTFVKATIFSPFVKIIASVTIKL